MIWSHMRNVTFTYSPLLSAKSFRLQNKTHQRFTPKLLGLLVRYESILVYVLSSLSLRNRFTWDLLRGCVARSAALNNNANYSMLLRFVSTQAFASEQQTKVQPRPMGSSFALQFINQTHGEISLDGKPEGHRSNNPALEMSLWTKLDAKMLGCFTEVKLGSSYSIFISGHIFFLSWISLVKTFCSYLQDDKCCPNANTNLCKKSLDFFPPQNSVFRIAYLWITHFIIFSPPRLPKRVLLCGPDWMIKCYLTKVTGLFELLGVVISAPWMFKGNSLCLSHFLTSSFRAWFCVLF